MFNTFPLTHFYDIHSSKVLGATSTGMHSPQGESDMAPPTSALLSGAPAISCTSLIYFYIDNILLTVLFSTLDQLWNVLTKMYGFIFLCH